MVDCVCRELGDYFFFSVVYWFLVCVLLDDLLMFVVFFDDWGVFGVYVLEMMDDRYCECYIVVIVWVWYL